MTTLPEIVHVIFGLKWDVASLQDVLPLLKAFQDEDSSNLRHDLSALKASGCKWRMRSQLRHLIVTSSLNPYGMMYKSV